MHQLHFFIDREVINCPFTSTMFKLLILFVFGAVSHAKAGVLHGGVVSTAVAAPLAYAAPALIAAPSAVSQQSRQDIINPTAYATVTSAQNVPIVAAGPSVQLSGSSAATSRLDVRGPIVAASPVAVGYQSVGYGYAGANRLNLGANGLSGLNGLGLNGLNGVNGYNGARGGYGISLNGHGI